MQLPEAVQRAAKRSNAIAEQLKQEKSQTQPGTTPLPENGIPKQADVDTLPNSVDPNATAPQPGDPADTKEDENVWKQRYLSLKGRFDNEMPRIQQDNQRMQGLVATLERQVEQLTAANNQPIQDRNGGDTDPKLDKEAFEEYGPDFVKLAETVESLRAENSQLKTQINNLTGDITTDKENQAKQKHTSYLNGVKAYVKGMGKDFVVLNSDPLFLDWLKHKPEDEIETRFARLKRAEANRDLEATKEIFKEYLGNPNAQVTPPETTTVQQNVPNLQPTTKTPGSDMTPPDSANKQIWTRTMISRFYEDKRKGVFDGRDEEAQAIEADIHLAAGEGRVKR